MEKEEIVSGIKQAIERGYSLEQAKRSFINAGYSIEDVEDSAKSFSGLSVSLPSKPQLQLQPIPQQQISQQPKRKSYALIILLVIVLLLLLAGLIATIFFKEKIIEFLHRIF